MRVVDRGQVLVATAVGLAAALVLVYLAAGGASYAPAEVQNPCEQRQWRDPEGLDQLAEQFTLSALDGAACELGVSREALARALASERSRERFARRYGLDDGAIGRAVQAGLLRAVDDAEAAGALSPLLAGPLRAGLRQIPPEQAIELIRNVESLLGGLDGIGGLFGPAQELLEQFLPRART